MGSSMNIHNNTFCLLNRVVHDHTLEIFIHTLARQKSNHTREANAGLLLAESIPRSITNKAIILRMKKSMMIRTIALAVAIASSSSADIMEDKEASFVICYLMVVSSGPGT